MLKIFYTKYTRILKKYEKENKEIKTGRGNMKLYKPFKAGTKENWNINKELKSTNSTGAKEVPLRFLKSNIALVAQMMNELLNKSLIKNVFPNQLKRFKTIPVFQKVIMKPWEIISQFHLFLLLVKL